MLRRSAALLLLAAGAVGVLASGGVQAARSSAPTIVSVQPNAFSAVVKWRVDDSARVVVEVGMDDRFGIWSPTTYEREPAVDRTTITGLEPATTYRFRVVARWRNGSRGEDRGTFRTDPWPSSISATANPAEGVTSNSGSVAPFILNPALPPKVQPGTPGPPGSTSPSTPVPPAGSSAPLRVNGVAFFPRMVWRQCPTYMPTSLAAGINVFLGVSCVAQDQQFAKLAGRAPSTTDAGTPGLDGPVHLGWHLPDEADVSVGNAAMLPKPKAAGRVTFLTVTDHFSSGAAPPPRGKEIYPGLFAAADVIGFDTYPIEVRCSIEQIDNVYWMQRELVQMVQGKPTFQWIEAGPMEHCLKNDDPNPSTVHVETWLSIAGGARGVGYFPDYWAENIRNQVRQDNRDIVSLAPALLSPVVNATFSPASPVRVSARKYNGAVYVIAANSSTSPATASFTVPGLAGRKLRVFADGRTVTPMGNLVVDKLPPLGVAVYVAPPAGW
jgi:hypothetical protein